MPLPRREAFRLRSHYVAALASEAVAPGLRAAARLRSRSAAPPAVWRRGIIIGHNHIGDVLYRTASLPHLRDALPDCEWHYLTTPGSAELLATNPHVGAVLPYARSDASWSLSAEHLRALHRNRYDVALCTNSVRHYPDLVLAAALGIGSRVAFDHKGLSGLITHPVPIPYPSPYPAYFRAMVAHVTGLEPRWCMRPEIFLSEADDELAAGRWRKLGLGAAPVVACTFTTRQCVSVWPAAEYVRTLQLVRGRMNVDVVLCGGAGDRPLLERVAAAAPFPCSILAGDLTLRGFAAFLRRCAVLLATDSGPRHLANAVRTPVVFVRGIAGSRIEPGVYCDSEVDLAPDVEFVPLQHIPHELTAVRPERVAESLLTVLRDRSTAG